MLIKKKQTLLDESDIADMVQKYVSGKTLLELEDEYGISHTTVMLYINLYLEKHNLVIRKVVMRKEK